MKCSEKIYNLKSILILIFQQKEHIALLALLNNLTANAIEAIEEYGVIAIAIQQQEDDTVITVCDNGKGIPQNELSIIFEPGYTTKYNVEGVAATGIGLSHVAALIAKLNGSITVESNDQKRCLKLSFLRKLFKRERLK